MKAKWLINWSGISSRKSWAHNAKYLTLWKDQLRQSLVLTYEPAFLPKSTLWLSWLVILTNISINLSIGLKIKLIHRSSGRISISIVAMIITFAIARGEILKNTQTNLASSSRIQMKRITNESHSLVKRKSRLEGYLLTMEVKAVIQIWMKSFSTSMDLIPVGFLKSASQNLSLALFQDLIVIKAKILRRRQSLKDVEPRVKIQVLELSVFSSRTQATIAIKLTTKTICNNTQLVTWIHSHSVRLAMRRKEMKNSSLDRSARGLSSNRAGLNLQAGFSIRMSRKHWNGRRLMIARRQKRLIWVVKMKGN